MRMRRTLGLVMALTMTGCASLPDATVSYHLPKLDVLIEAELTYSCDGHVPRIESITTGATPIYSSDPAAIAHLDLATLNRWYASSEVEIHLTPDGRLASIGSSSAGDAASWAKAAAVAAAIGFELYPAAAVLIKGDQPLIAAGMAPSEDSTPVPTTAQLLCEGLVQDEKRPVRVIPYRGWMKWEDLGTAADRSDDVALKADETTHFGRLARSYWPSPRVYAANPQTRGFVSEAKGAVLSVHARRLRSFGLFLVGGNTDRLIGTVSVPDGREGGRYEMPLLAPTAIGKRATTLRFNNDGSIAMIKYGSPAADAIGDSVATLGSALQAGLKSQDEAATSLASQRAARLKAEADILAAEARLSQCKTDPGNCK